MPNNINVTSCSLCEFHAVLPVSRDHAAWMDLGMFCSVISHVEVQNSKAPDDIPAKAG